MSDSLKIDARIIGEAAALLDACRAKSELIATAESCTGGLVAATLTAIPGSSDVFERGFVTYSNAAKSEMLGVPGLADRAPWGRQRRCRPRHGRRRLDALAAPPSPSP